MKRQIGKDENDTSGSLINYWLEKFVIIVKEIGANCLIVINLSL